ncbi:hypothetical protein [Elizabethkingia ursingii]|uniref:Uncharacterized protein n=1 Tax=Elizabethkingia ursingii TaxID=1756150 RepID=A0ABX3NAB8_9FLAO|nr:hypothetical protein [Elizabethkingia ursingii]OPB91197.1 hypothetical protein BB021_04370 [Elizabethkingia ursingii]
MNIYHFIYCFFWRKDGGGRLYCSLYVLWTLIFHILLIAETIRDITGFKILGWIPDYGNLYNKNKYMYFLFSIPFWLILFFFYNKKRTQRLLKEYDMKYGNAGRKNTIRILLYIIAPTLLAIALVIMRQGGALHNGERI